MATDLPRPSDIPLLLASYFNAALDTAQLAELEQWVQHAPENADAFARYAIEQRALEAALRRDRIGGLADLSIGEFDSDRVDTSELELVSPGVTPDTMSLVVDQALALRHQHEIEDAANKQLAAQQAEDARNRRFELRRQAEPRQVRRAFVVPQLVVWLGLAAMLGLAATVVYQLNRPGPQATEPTAEQTPGRTRQWTPQIASGASVAKLTESFDAGWLVSKPNGSGEFRPGTYTLTRGWAQVENTQGVVVVLEAPVTFKLDEDNAIVLTQGQLVAEVPQRAHGFTVHTPSGRVIDYGTTFGVVVNDAGSTLAHVFQGEVEVASLGSTATTVRLGRDEAALVRTGGPVTRTSARPEVFARKVPATSYQAAVFASRPMCYWRGPIDETTSLLTDHGWLGAHGQASSAVLNHPAGFLPDDPTGSLDFGTRDDAVISVPPYEAFDLQGAFSVEVWCWVEPGHPDHMRVFSTRTASEGVGLAIAGNLSTGEFDKPNVPMLTFFGQRDVFGSAPLPEGEWSLLAAVVDERGQVKMYLNGEEMKILVVERGDAIDRPPSRRPLMIGRNPYTELGAQSWLGRLDELSIYARALSKEEIVEHYRVFQGL